MTTATATFSLPAFASFRRERAAAADARRLKAPSLGLALMAAAALWGAIGSTVALLVT
jgi:hypothetical protein